MNWRKYFQATWIGFKEASTYRFNAVMSFIGAILFLVLYYAIWKSIAAAGTLNSSLAEVMTYIVLGQVITNSISMGTESYVGDRIRKGTIVNELKRPFSFRLQSYFHELGYAVFRTSTRAIPLFFLGYLFVDMQLPSTLNLVGFIVSVFLGFHLMFSFAFMTATLVFWTKVGWSIRGMRRNIENVFSGVLFPLYLLPAPLKPVFNALPFQAMVDGPISIFMMRRTGVGILEVFGKQVIWTIILLIIGSFMWLKARKKMTVQGG